MKISDEFVIKKIDSWVTLVHLQLLTKLTDSSRLPRKKHVASLLNAHLHHIIKSIAIAVNSSKGTFINEAFPLGQGILLILILIRGSFFNHVDQILPNFEHLPTPYRYWEDDLFMVIKKNRHINDIFI